MTIDTIFARYDVPNDIQLQALRRGAFVLALKDAWVGPTVTWPLLVKVLIFADLGETSAHIRKKIGLDKYAVTLITRGVPKYAPLIASSHDWHQKLYVYSALQTGVLSAVEKEGEAFQSINEAVQHNLLHGVTMPHDVPQQTEHALRGINILHYKNPSV